MNPYLAWCQKNKLDFTNSSSWKAFYDTQILTALKPFDNITTIEFDGIPLTFYTEYKTPRPDYITREIFNAWKQNRELIHKDNLEYKRYKTRPSVVFAKKMDRSFLAIINGICQNGSAGDYIVANNNRIFVMSGPDFAEHFQP